MPTKRSGLVQKAKLSVVRAGDGNQVQELEVPALSKIAAPTILKKGGVRVFNVHNLISHNRHISKYGGVKVTQGPHKGKINFRRKGCSFCEKGVGAVIRTVEEHRAVVADEVVEGDRTD